MSVHLYSCDLAQERYVRVVAPCVDITYRVAALGFLTRTFLAKDITPFEVGRHSITDSKIPIVKRIGDMFKSIEADMQKIANHWDWVELRQGIEAFEDFSNRVNSVRDNPEFEEINLSGLDLNFIPFQIGLFVKTKKLDLRNNQLRILPLDFLHMSELEEVDLRGNPIVQLPSWCETKLAHVKFTTDILQDDPENWAQS